MTKPTTYDDWKRLYHEQVRCLGWSAKSYFSFKRAWQRHGLHIFAERIPLIRRRMEYTLSRIKRIEMRMDETRPLEQLLEAIFEEPAK